MKINPQIAALIEDYEHTIDQAIIDFAEKWASVPKPPKEAYVGTAIVTGTIKMALMLALARGMKIDIAHKKGSIEFFEKGLEEVGSLITEYLSDKTPNKYSFVIVKQKR